MAKFWTWQPCSIQMTLQTQLTVKKNNKRRGRSQLLFEKKLFNPEAKFCFSFEFWNFDFPLVTILDNWWFDPYLFCRHGQLFQLTECELGRMIFLLRNVYHYIKIEKTTICLFFKEQTKSWFYYRCIILLLSITGAFFLNFRPVEHFFLQSCPWVNLSLKPQP